jgi:NAD+ synthetase
VEFLRDEVQRRRGFDKVVIGLSGGVDSSLVAFLAAEALGPENVIGVRMPYRTSSPESLEHAGLVIAALGIEARTVDISAAVDGLASAIGGGHEPGRLGNIMARARMITLFDLSAAERALPLGTGNKTERLLGYFTWHADDSPPVNPIGDLFKTQVWALARFKARPTRVTSASPIPRPTRSCTGSWWATAPTRSSPWDSARRRSPWFGGGWIRPTGSGGSRRWRCSARRRSASTT